MNVYVERAPEAIETDLQVAVGLDHSGHAPTTISVPRKQPGRICLSVEVPVNRAASMAAERPRESSIYIVST